MQKRLVLLACIAILLIHMLCLSLPVMGESDPDNYTFNTFEDDITVSQSVYDIFTPPVLLTSDPDTDNYTFDISEGNITVSAGTNQSTVKVVYANNQIKDNISDTQEITITGTTENYGIVVNGVYANITIAGVNIQNNSNNFCVFELTDKAGVTLTLIGTNTLKSGEAKAGLQALDGAVLTIRGDGSLNAAGGYRGAGIGGGSGGAGGSITIEGGEVTASGGDFGAGIGGGGDHGYGGAGGSIRIEGGEVTASGGYFGAGIGGGGNFYGNGGAGGSIAIEGGEVTASGGECGAGIGGGYFGAGGSIKIEGGEVTASGGKYGAGIGGGRRGAGGSITIEGGEVTVSGGYKGAGIGGGGGDHGYGGAAGTITINDTPIVKAVSDNLNRPAIHAESSSLTGSTARVLMANFTNQQSRNVTTAVYTKTSSSSCIDFAPEIDYQSIAFTVPADTYRLKTADNYQQHSSGAGVNADFSIPGTGLTIFRNVKEAADVSVYDITYYLDDGINHPDNAATYTQGIGMPLNDPTRDKYVFDGWYEDFSQGSVREISTTDSEHKTLYAKWNPTYTIAPIENQTMTPLTAGYKEGTQKIKEIAIERTGSGDLSNLTVSLGGNNNFIIVTKPAQTLNDTTPRTTFAIKAKDDLAAGTYTATITVTANNMEDVNYEVRQLVNSSSNCSLSSLTLNPGTLNPVFDPNTVNYTADVTYNISSISVTSVTADANAIVTVNGQSVVSGQVSPVINLGVGSNTISIVVTAQDGTTTRTYTIFVTKPPPSSNAELSSLTLNPGTLNPVFDPNTASYTADVTYNISSISVTPVTADSNAIVTVNNQNVAGGQTSPVINLGVGNNTISIVVTAQDGTTSRTYTITVSKASSGSSSSSKSSTPSAPIINAILNSGMYKENLAVTIDETGKSALVSLSEDILDDAFARVKSSSDGLKKVKIEIPEIPDINFYELELPASSLTSGNGNRKIEMTAKFGTVTLPGNMLRGTGLENIGDVRISIGEADKSKLPEDLQDKIGNRPVIELKLLAGDRTLEWNNPDAPVTVTIPYTPTEEELADPDNITVWYIDGAGNVVEVPNGRYDPETGTVTFTTTHFSMFAVVYITGIFDDLEDVPWAEEQIEFLAGKDVLIGTAEREYSPQADITRADFLYSLVRTLALDEEVDGNFDDIKSDAYYYKEIGIAKKLGITKGTGSNKFSPDAEITRQDMMVLTERTLRILQKLNVQGTVSDLNKFRDKSLIANYAAESIATLISEGLIIGNDDKINPLGNTTRAEAAVFLYRIYNKY